VPARRQNREFDPPPLFPPGRSATIRVNFLLSLLAAVLKIVVDDLADWGPFYPSEHVMAFADYLALAEEPLKQPLRIINLCRSDRYLSRGYYCSLLAEARGHRVLPNVATLNILRNRKLFILEFDDIEERVDQLVAEHSPAALESFSVKSYFGTVREEILAPLARDLFERFACPILEIEFRKRSRWEIAALTPLAPTELSDEEQTVFAEALERYSRAVWRRPRERTRYRYDMAILVDPQEPTPPSDAKAIKHFMKAGKRLGIAVDLIKRSDYGRLQEYDALFIRATTAIDHFTFRFAQKAESEDMVVIDDPTSILRCTNKVYLADLLRMRRIPAPDTRILIRQPQARTMASLAGLSFPMVLKIPDGSFSKGVVKVRNEDELQETLRDLFKKSALLLAQEYLYTDYDWRIGVLNNRAIFACKYFMVRDHWQIYRYGSSGDVDSGHFQTLPTHEVPRAVIETALRATRPIGNGLYGVDIKQSGERIAVIEVNDNPSIEFGVEDQYLGLELYHLIMEDFLRRLDEQRANRPR
jgi:glutathione synthase/RimK-type ligase-like ATP-grasp enzyme